MKLTGLNLIGCDQSGKGNLSFQAINPFTQRPLETVFMEATTAEVSAAAEKAEKAFLFYQTKSNEERAQFLEAIAEEILDLGDLLIERCSTETALPESRLKGERTRTVTQLRLFADVVREGSWIDARIDTAISDRKPAPKPDIRQMQTPLGPAGIFGASNFPLAFSVAGGDTAAALAAGCPVVVKAHPLHPGTSELVGHAAIKAAKSTNMPEGVFSLVHGTSTNVGMSIVLDPRITAIGFTGSFKGGKAIFDAANQREKPIPVFAEMGSVNPVFILPGAMKERKEEIAEGMVNSLNLGTGQFCTNPGLVFTHTSGETEQFLQHMKQLVTRLGPGTMLSAGIKNNYLSGVKRLLEAEGVYLVGRGRESENGNQARINIFTTDCATFLNHKVLEEEVFGPSTLNVSTQNREELIKVAEKMDGHLTATIHGTEKDLSDYADLIRILERKAGRLIFNGYPTGVEVCHSMVHGGPFPATTASQFTSVGTNAIRRFSRPVCYQDFPQSSLPDSLKDANPLDIWRLVDGRFTKEKI